MSEASRGIVVFGDIVDSRREAAASTSFLRSLASELESCYPREVRLAAIAITQGDELQALLAPGADPFVAVVRAGLRDDARRLRWVIVSGAVDPGRGPATERTGAAFLRARELMDRAKSAREPLLAETGDPWTDRVLGDLAPVLPRLLGDLTLRQREAARPLVLEGLRRAEVAERLGISRATVSVMADRAGVREIMGLARALATLFHSGAERSRDAGLPERPA